jgi:aarF domain-containing kinase
MFDSFEEYPIASGSIAQVYRAVYNKQKVAVKVRHPNVEMQIKMDFDIMNAIIVCIENFFGLDWLNLSESMIQFSHTIASQTDLEVESYHLHLFEENFRGWKVFNFPKPILTRKSIIIESFLPGDHVSSLIDLVKQRSDGKYPLQLLDAAHFIVTRGEDLYLKMLIQDNLMHADMHPGNIFLQLIPKKSVDDSLKDIDKYWMFNKQYMNYEIGLVDAGMVAILTESEKRNFIGLLEAMGEGDGFEAADCVLEFSLANRQQKMQSDDEYNKRNNAFKVDMSKLFKMISRGYGTNVDIGEVLRGILTLIRKHRITIDTNYATLVMNALCLDSLAKSLLPSYSILDGAKLLLRLNRRAKRLPLFVRTIAMKVVFTTMLRMKQMQDQWFLRKTKVDHALL